jgi:hypothetical protein
MGPPFLRYFYVKTGVRQGCVMPVMLFNLVIDWVMSKTTENSPRGIRWGLFSTLEDLDFADDFALLLTHTLGYPNRLQMYGKQGVLRIGTKQTDTITLNVKMPAPVKARDEELDRQLHVPGYHHHIRGRYKGRHPKQTRQGQESM